jgi:hypothetical protein
MLLTCSFKNNVLLLCVLFDTPLRGYSERTGILDALDNRST